MTDMKAAMKEAQAHATLVARAKRDRDKQIAAAVVRANAACNRKVAESLDGLSPAAARVVCAFAEPHPPLVMAMKEAMASGAWPTGDPNPAPAWLNEAPPPAVGIVEVAEKQGKRARG